MFAPAGPAEVPKSSELSEARAHWCRGVQCAFKQAYGFTPAVPIVGQDEEDKISFLKNDQKRRFYKCKMLPEAQSQQANGECFQCSALF